MLEHKQGCGTERLEARSLHIYCEAWVIQMIPLVTKHMVLASLTRCASKRLAAGHAVGVLLPCVTSMLLALRVCSDVIMIGEWMHVD